MKNVIIAQLCLLQFIATLCKAQTTYSNTDGRKYKVLTVAPVQLLQSGLGTAINYEQGIDSGGFLSFSGQGMYSLDLTKKYSSSESTLDPMFYVMPGIKVYPTTLKGELKYSFTTSFFLGAGQISTHNKVTRNTDVNGRITAGLMIINTINCREGAHFNYAIDYGLGVAYLDRYGNINNGMKLLNLLAFRFGYVF